MTVDVDSAENRDIATRRRRAAYRANHRGTKEMDWLVGRFADAHLEDIDDPGLREFERFLEMPDPELQKWILDPDRTAGGDFGDLIARIRAFHGLTAAGKV
ncbi:MAG: succinate dehydrogenase assembly factor 2 [Hyphomicrobiaceae bacterium]